MAVIHFDDLARLRREFANKRIVYCSGVFDLTHAGHVLFFEDCKRFGDILVVGVGNDAHTRASKGTGRPVVHEAMRLKMIASLKPVDFCYLDLSVPGQVHPLAHLESVFAQLQPDVYAVNQDASDIPYREQVTKQFGIPMKIMPRSCPPEFEEISTTKIIEKIKQL